MKKQVLIIITLVLLLSAAVCFADDTTFKYRFADAKEAAELLLSNRDYYDNLSQNDLNYRMQKLDATLAELEAFTATQTRDFTDEEKSAIDAAMAAIEQTCKEYGYKLPATDNIIFAKTTMQEECDAGAYTHGTQIYFGEKLLGYANSDNPDAQFIFREVVAHELFHCLTRNYPDFREAMYGILGFTVVAEDYDFAPEIDAVIISNPDVGHHNSYATFEIDGEMKDCVVIFTSDPFAEPGDFFFNSMQTGLVPVDDLSVMYLSEDAANFWDVFGKNTSYVIDPEETMADNFSYAITYGLDDVEYNTPEIIEGIIEYLRK